MKRQNVGRDLKALAGEGLLELVDTAGGQDIWAKKALDRTLRISKFLEDAFKLASDGRPAKKKKKRRHR